jgi:lysosomal acid lipase/cholesteryl ester hydrolase
MNSATVWVIHDKNNSPAFTMLENGYDVWLGNNRGTPFSRNHTVLNPDKDSEFWKFSF